jgi:hypothetical protein
MKRDIYGLSIHGELQPRTNVDGVGDAKQIKEHSEENRSELCRLWKNLPTERKDSKLRFRTVLLFSLR